MKLWRFRVSGLGLDVGVSSFGCGFRVSSFGLRFRVSGLGFGFGLRVQVSGSEFRLHMKANPNPTDSEPLTQNSIPQKLPANPKT